MTWNWELPEWPNFSYDPDAVRIAEDRFLQETGRFFGVISHLDADDINRVRIELMSDEALETSRIEGEMLDRDSLQSSLRREFGLATDSRRVTAAEQGVSEVLVDVYRQFDLELTAERLCRWHGMLMQGRPRLRDIGRFRMGSESMQIVSGPDYDPTVHFVAPPSAKVPDEMERFIGWFNASQDRMPALARAAISHVYFESIHPFEDGNGRIGRAIAELSLSQTVGKPVLIALSQAIAARKRDYYAGLAKASRTLEISAWVGYFADTVIDAQKRSSRVVSFIIEKGKFFGRFRQRISPRQEKVLLRMFDAGPDGFIGGLSAGNYRSIAKTTVPTTTRDLNALVEIGALKKTGEKRHTRYWLNIPEAV